MWSLRARLHQYRPAKSDLIEAGKSSFTPKAIRIPVEHPGMRADPAAPGPLDVAAGSQLRSS